MATSSITLVEIGAQFATGLQFLEGDTEKALSVITKKYNGTEVVLKMKQPAIAANPEKGIEGKPEQPEVTLKIGDDTRDELLAAIATLPTLRNQFATTVADLVNEGREGDTDYAKLIKEFDAARAKWDSVRSQILEFDQKNAGKFPVEEFVKWIPYGEVEPKSFVGNVQHNSGSSGRSGSRSRAQSAKWSLPVYKAKQQNVGDYHDVTLVRSGDEWAVQTAEGELLRTTSPNRAMRDFLENYCGLSPQRSANVFWDAYEQEQGKEPW